jgi:hypothetical protein
MGHVSNGASGNTEMVASAVARAREKGEANASAVSEGEGGYLGPAKGFLCVGSSWQTSDPFQKRFVVEVRHDRTEKTVYVYSK